MMFACGPSPKSVAHFPFGQNLPTVVMFSKKVGWIGW